MYSIERTLLSTYIRYDSQLSDESSSKIKSYEFKEETFKDQYFRIVVKTINHLRQLSKPYYDDVLAEHLENNGVYHMERFMDILSANIVTPSTFKDYLEDLEGKNLKSFHGDV